MNGLARIGLMTQTPVFVETNFLYAQSANPPVLHRKEAFLPPTTRFTPGSPA